VKTAFNFLPWRRRAAAARRRLLGRWGVFAAVLAAMLTGCTLAVARMFPAPDQAATQREIDALQTEAARLQENISKLERGVAAASRSIAASRATVDHPDWSVLLVRVLAARPDTMIFRRWALTRSDATKQELLSLRLEGETRDLGRVTDFVMQLESFGIFRRVSLIRASSRASMLATGDDSIEFAIDGELLVGGTR